MHFVIYCRDREKSAELRAANFEAHKTHLATGQVSIVVSGPLLDDDGETVIGSLFIIEADGLDAVAAFNAADPFNAAGIWDSVAIHPFHKRIDNRA